MKQTLKMNGYPQHLIRRTIREGEAIVKKILKNTHKKQPNSPTTNNIILTLTYDGLESDVLPQRIRKICCRYSPLVNINTTFKKTFTPKNILSPIQTGVDETKKEKESIYNIPCYNCNKSYIAKTAPEKSTRVQKHQNDTKKMSDSSNIIKYAIEHKYSFNSHQAQTLSFENNRKRRIIKVTLHTQQISGQALNDVKFKQNVFA